MVKRLDGESTPDPRDEYEAIDYSFALINLHLFPQVVRGERRGEFYVIGRSVAPIRQEPAILTH